VNGKISFNVDSYYQGKYHEEIVLTFENGRVIRSSAKDSMALNEVLDTDEGASYIGEFAFGLNPKIEKPLGDILFDEKVYGSIHLALGNCYEVAPNGNSSAIHWDLVLIQTPEFGGGEIYFDDVLVRKDGEFLLESLRGLNR
jgi:aminopeptidase